VIGTLGFQTRPVQDVLEELDHLRARGVRELFFMDQTFGVVKRALGTLRGARTTRRPVLDRLHATRHGRRRAASPRCAAPVATP
jgi:hypothetical protein